MERDDDEPLELDSPATVGRVREVLDRADYTGSGLTGLLGMDGADFAALPNRSRKDQVLMRRTEGGSPLEILVRLFLLGEPVPIAAARRALGPVDLEEWIRLGLVEVIGEAVAGVLALVPFQGFVFASDRLSRKARSRASHVLGVAGSSRSLARLTIRQLFGATLDLGTGSGIQAILSAFHSVQVTAVDRNPRAVKVARFNARLNDVTNLECLEGDRFEPVAGRRFDLVLANAPFVVTPSPRYLYRDGASGDGFSEGLVRAVPAFLNEGGFAQILVNIAHVGGQGWRERLGDWLAGSGCDAWTLRFSTVDVLNYANQWVMVDDDSDSAAYDRRFDDWMEYYQRERIGEITLAVVNLRRRSSDAVWTRFDDAPEPLGPCGAAIVGGFAARDFLETVRDDAALLAARLRRNPEMRLERTLQPTESGWSVAKVRCRQTSGFDFSTNLDIAGFQLLNQCRGELTLGEAVTQAAAAAGEDPATILPACLDLVRNLVEQRFLLPVNPDPASGTREILIR